MKSAMKGALIEQMTPNSTLRIQMSADPMPTHHPIQSYRWAAALQLYGDAAEQAAVPEMLILSISPTNDLVTQAMIDTANLINTRIPKADRATARQRINVLADQMRAKAMGRTSAVKTASARRGKGSRSAGLADDSDTLLGALVAAAGALLLFG